MKKILMGLAALIAILAIVGCQKEELPTSDPAGNGVNWGYAPPATTGVNVVPGTPGAQWMAWSNVAHFGNRGGLHDPGGADDRNATTGCGAGYRGTTSRDLAALVLATGALVLHQGDTSQAPYSVPANFAYWADTTSTWQQGIVVAGCAAAPAGFVGTLFCPRAVNNGPIADPEYAQSFWVKVLDSQTGEVLETILFWVTLSERAHWGLPAQCVGATVFVKPKAGVTTPFLSDPKGWEDAAPQGNLGSAATVGSIPHFWAQALKHGAITTVPGSGPGGSTVDTVLAISNSEKVKLNGWRVSQIRNYPTGDSLRVTVLTLTTTETVTLRGAATAGSVAYDFVVGIDEPNPYFGRADAGPQPERRAYSYAFMAPLYADPLSGGPTSLALEITR